MTMSTWSTSRPSRRLGTAGRSPSSSRWPCICASASAGFPGVTDRLQPGIYLRPGERPPPAYGLLLLDLASGTTPAQAGHAIARVVEPQPDVDVLIGLGRRVFDHDPPLTYHERPALLAWLDGYPLIPWTGENTGEADLALQVTGPHAAAVNCAAVAVWERIAKKRLPRAPPPSPASDAQTAAAGSASTTASATCPPSSGGRRSRRPAIPDGWRAAST